jgi:hypothetical protein
VTRDGITSSPGTGFTWKIDGGHLTGTTVATSTSYNPNLTVNASETQNITVTATYTTNVGGNTISVSGTVEIGFVSLSNAQTALLAIRNAASADDLLAALSASDAGLSTIVKSSNKAAYWANTVSSASGIKNNTSLATALTTPTAANIYTAQNDLRGAILTANNFSAGGANNASDARNALVAEIDQAISDAGSTTAKGAALKAKLSEGAFKTLLGDVNGAKAYDLYDALSDDAKTGLTVAYQSNYTTTLIVANLQTYFNYDRAVEFIDAIINGSAEATDYDKLKSLSVGFSYTGIIPPTGSPSGFINPLDAALISAYIRDNITFNAPVTGLTAVWNAYSGWEKVQNAGTYAGTHINTTAKNNSAGSGI